MLRASADKQSVVDIVKEFRWHARFARAVFHPLARIARDCFTLGPHAGEVVRAPYGEGLEALGVVYGLPVIGFAFAWMAIAAMITVRTARRKHMPFSLTWWSFTFPVGTVVTGTSVLATQTGARPFAWLAVGIFALLLVAWATALLNTVRIAWTGAAFLPAPR